MAYKITGRVLKKFAPLTLPSKSGNSYTKQDLVIAVRRFDSYTGEPIDDETNTPKFTFFGERINDLVPIREGDLVTVHFEISGRPYTKEDGKTEYFNDIRPLRVDKTQSNVLKEFQAPLEQNNTNIPPQPNSQVTEAPMSPTDKDDDLPF